jgi:hypothetical protein
MKLSSSVVHTNNNGLHTLEQVFARKIFIPRFVEEVDLVYYGKKGGRRVHCKKEREVKIGKWFPKK